MGDGHLNKCKDCTKKDTKDRLEIKLSDPEWYEGEKERHREKYYRLGYRERHKPTKENKKVTQSRYYEKYPEKTKRPTSKTPPGMNAHHWSYLPENIKNTILISTKDHYKLHRNIQYIQELMCYVSKNGNLLDTREKHVKYAESIGITIT